MNFINLKLQKNKHFYKVRVLSRNSLHYHEPHYKRIKKDDFFLNNPPLFFPLVLPLEVRGHCLHCFCNNADGFTSSS